MASWWLKIEIMSQYSSIQEVNIHSNNILGRDFIKAYVHSVLFA
jgi:hypothetical protein